MFFGKLFNQVVNLLENIIPAFQKLQIGELGRDPFGENTGDLPVILQLQGLLEHFAVLADDLQLILVDLDQLCRFLYRFHHLVVDRGQL